MSVRDGSVVADDLGLESLEALHGHMLNQGVHLLPGLLVLVPSARHSHADAVWDTPDAMAPHVLVQLGVNADVHGAHGLKRELADLPDRTRGPSLELDLVQALVHVDGLVPGHWLHGLASTLLDRWFGHGFWGPLPP